MKPYSKRNLFSSEIKYDQIPIKLRNQVIHIWNEVMQNPYIAENDLKEQFYNTIHDHISKEHGHMCLNDALLYFERGNSKYKSLIKYFLKSDLEVGDLLDIIEFSFQLICSISEKLQNKYGSNLIFPREYAKQDLNRFFMEQNVGFQFMNNIIVRMDSDFLHTESIAPTSILIRQKEFISVDEEFTKALHHYRFNRYAECINECAKAFESMLKIICDTNQWEYDKGSATAKKLITVCKENKLFDSILENHFQHLLTALESGVPTVRNKRSAHGAGSDKNNIPGYLANFVINSTAASLKLFVDASGL
jgi:hypothetical protein